MSDSKQNKDESVKMDPISTPPPPLTGDAINNDKTMIDHHLRVGSYTPIDLLFDLVPMACYVLDVGTDLNLVYLYFTESHWWWFGLTLTFVLASFMVTTCISVYKYHLLMDIVDKVSTCRWVSRVIFHIFLLGPVIRYIESVEYGLRSWYNSNNLVQLVQQGELCIVECFLEAAPQLCLQLYIVTISENDLALAQYLAMTTSLVSMSWALCFFEKAKLQKSIHKTKFIYVGVVLLFFWRFFILSARIIAILLYASYVRGWVFVVLGCHWFVMLGWLLIQSDEKCYEFLLHVIEALMFIIYYFPITDGGHTRLGYIFYYTMVYLENMAMILVWYLFTQSLDLWYRDYALVAVLGGFFLGIGIQVAYYLRCHPNSQHIKVCLPLEELLAVPEKSSQSVNIPNTNR